jgi:tetratricopeptide (TPR) repeat protein
VVLLKQYAALIFDAGNPNGAEATLNRANSLAPNDPEVLAMLGQVTRAKGDLPRSVGYFQRAFRIVELSGGRMSETRYRLALGLAERARLRPAAVEFARLLVTNYPSGINWRDALIVFRTVDAPVDPALTLDTVRLMRATGAIAGERDVLATARLADGAGGPSDAKAILDEGVTRGMASGTDAGTRTLLTGLTTRATAERTGVAARVARARTAAGTGADARAAGDLLFGQGRYAEAAELYSLALTKPGEDPNLVNGRLGEALALAGRRAEAEAAFRAVQPGPRADLSALWLAWLARAPAA